MYNYLRMLTLDYFTKNINAKIEENNFNTLTFNFGQIINDYLFFHNIDDLELYIKKIKQKEYNFYYKSYQKLTDGINDYIIDYDKQHNEHKEIKKINMIESRGFQDVLHLKSSKDIKVIFKNLFHRIINYEEVPQSLDQINEEIIEFEINQYIKLIIINQKYPEISEVKNNIVINLTIVENQDENNLNLQEVYNLISYILQE